MADKKTQTLAELLEERDDNALADLLESASGRWFFARLLKSSGVWPPRYGDFSSEQRAAMDEGARRMGIDLVRRAEKTAKGCEALWKMMAEYRENMAWMTEIAKEGKGVCRYE